MPLLTAADLDDLAARSEPAATVEARLDTATIGTLLASWNAGVAVRVLPPEGEVPRGEAEEGWGAGAQHGDTHPALFSNPHTLVPTSGTSGRPKIVVLTRDNVAAAVAASQARLGNVAGDRWLLALPLHHVGGLSVLWRSVAAGGAVLLHDRFDAERVAGALRTGEATIASLVPTMLHRVLAADPGPYPPATVLLGGAAAPRRLVERGLAAGLAVLATYGLTEACSQVATVAPGEERHALGTVGRPLDGLDVTITEDGRIAVTGPQVSPGYAGEPPRRGPLVTNDVGRFDDEGRLVVLGRADDVIVTGGENVWPQRVEDALREHPGVADVAVHGMPDAEWGERVAAAYVGEAAPDELAAWARDRLAGHEVPRLWQRAARLPRTESGKVDKARLAALAGG